MRRAASNRIKIYPLRIRMPELPEVETIARSLREGGRGAPSILGRKVAGARLLWARTLAEPAADTFHERLPGQVVTGVGRRAKFLVISLSTDTLLIHLRMSGDIRVEAGLDEDGDPLPLQPHDRLSLDFYEDGHPAACGWRSTTRASLGGSGWSAIHRPR